MSGKGVGEKGPRACCLCHVMDPRLPVPLHAQLLLFTTDILAGPLYPAAVQDIDYRAIDVFVNKRVLANHLVPSPHKCDFVEV